MDVKVSTRRMWRGEEMILLLSPTPIKYTSSTTPTEMRLNTHTRAILYQSVAHENLRLCHKPNLDACIV